MSIHDDSQTSMIFDRSTASNIALHPNELVQIDGEYVSHCATQSNGESEIPGLERHAVR